MAQLEKAALLWMDLELSGLDVSSDSILEIALLATSPTLEPLGGMLEVVVAAPPSTLALMNAEVAAMHRRSGLLRELSSPAAMSIRDAERLALAHISGVVASTPVVHCGYYLDLDREILAREMPSLRERLGFRTLDLRSLEEAAEAWLGGRIARTDIRVHRAGADVQEALRLARAYRTLMASPDKA